MVARFIYRYIFKRTSTFVLATVLTTVFFEQAYDRACEAIFCKINEGKLWIHIKDRYENPIDPAKYNGDSRDDKNKENEKNGNSGACDNL